MSRFVCVSMHEGPRLVYAAIQIARWDQDVTAVSPPCDRLCYGSPIYSTARMKLQQLRFLTAVVQNDLNLTAAAAKLATTQPAVSKQLKLLEGELGFRIFTRRGRAFTKLTAPGERIVTHALRVLREVQNIKRMSEEFKHEDRGALAIGTTHTQARYVLPGVIKTFCEKYPDVEFHLHQGTSAQIRAPSLEDLAKDPLVTYVFSFTGPSSLTDAFARVGLSPRIALTARDSDVVKTYVRHGLGVGIVAGMALDPKEDQDLVSIEATHLFPIHTTWIGFFRDGLLRQYMYDFLQILAPHLTRRVVDRAVECETPEEVAALFAREQLPVR